MSISQCPFKPYAPDFFMFKWLLLENRSRYLKTKLKFEFCLKFWIRKILIKFFKIRKNLLNILKFCIFLRVQSAPVTKQSNPIEFWAFFWVLSYAKIIKNIIKVYVVMSISRTTPQALRYRFFHVQVALTNEPIMLNKNQTYI